MRLAENEDDASRCEFWPIGFEKTRSTVNFLPDRDDLSQTGSLEPLLEQVTSPATAGL